MRAVEGGGTCRGRQSANRGVLEVALGEEHIALNDREVGLEVVRMFQLDEKVEVHVVERRTHLEAS